MLTPRTVLRYIGKRLAKPYAGGHIGLAATNGVTDLSVDGRATGPSPRPPWRTPASLRGLSLRCLRHRPRTRPVGPRPADLMAGRDCANLIVAGSPKTREAVTRCHSTRLSGLVPKTVLGECDEYGAAVFPTDAVPHRCDSKPVFSGKLRSVGTPKGHYYVRGDEYRRAGRGANSWRSDRTGPSGGSSEPCSTWGPSGSEPTVSSSNGSRPRTARPPSWPSQPWSSGTGRWSSASAGIHSAIRMMSRMPSRPPS